MFSSKIIAKTLYGMVEDDGRSADYVAQSFFSFLKRFHMLALAPQVLDYLELERERRAGSLSMRITSAVSIEGKTVEKIKRYVKAPQDTHTILATNESLIGGFSAGWEGKVYDASIKTQLEKLREKLLM
jgi:F0F1-type ATP synthase delta subunit